MKMPKRRKRRDAPKKATWYENLAMFLEVLVIVFFTNAFLLQAFAIPSASMEPAMLIGDHVLVDRAAFSRSLTPLGGVILPQVKIARGMEVVFKAPPEIRTGDLSRLYYVKRVIGLPGEVIRMAGNQVFIDGRPLDEPYRNLTSPQAVSVDFPPANGSGWPEEFPVEYRSLAVDTPGGRGFRVPEGHFFCLGDNRNISADSRTWGPLPADCVAGKPWRVYWSTRATTEDMIGKGFAERIWKFATGLISKTRWERIPMKY